MRLSQAPEWWSQDEWIGFRDHFNFYITLHNGWSSLAADSGSSVAITANAAGGVVALTTGATSNNEVGFFNSNAIFKMAAGKSIYGEVLLQYDEAATNDAAVWAGFSDQAAANLLVDTTGIPATTMSGFGIYKRAEETVWRGFSSKSTTQSDSKSTTTAGGSSYQRLGFEFTPGGPGTTKGTVSFYINEQQILLSGLAMPYPIQHEIDFSSAAAMKFGVYVKSAGGATGEVVSVDLAKYLAGPYNG